MFEWIQRLRFGKQYEYEMLSTGRTGGRWETRHHPGRDGDARGV